MWVGGCVTARAAWASPPGRRRKSVHKLAKMASRRRFGAFVYTVATREDRSSDRGDAGVYTDWQKWTPDAVLGHLCTLLHCCGQPWGRRSVHKSVEMASRSYFGAFVYTVATREDRSSDRGDAGVYTDWRKWPLDAVLGHLCTLLRRDSPRRQPTRTPEEPKKDMSLRIIWQDHLAGETMLDRSWRYFPATLYAPCLARLRCPASF